MNSPAALGIKADWGASINGVMPRFNYELSYTLGTGNEISDSDGGLVAGRIGTRAGRFFRLGVSFLEGEQRSLPCHEDSGTGSTGATVAPGS